ncbi:type II toxin-antitoxin system ParD family antitoxin [Propionibacteriaceae bacterium G1746]
MAQNTSTSPDQETQLAALRQALADGEASGPAVPFDFDAFIASRKQ